MAENESACLSLRWAVGGDGVVVVVVVVVIFV